jgi:hypothetical protein
MATQDRQVVGFGGNGGLNCPNEVFDGRRVSPCSAVEYTNGAEYWYQLILFLVAIGSRHID